jgi:hypothetical protein
MSDQLPYGVVESAKFLRKAQKISGSCVQWDEVKRTIDLDLARNPHIFQEIPGHKLYGVIIPLSPPRVLYFTVDDQKQQIRLEDIE